MKFVKRVLIEALLYLVKSACVLVALLPSRFVLWLTSLAGSLVGKCCAKDGKVSVAQLRYAFPQGLGTGELTESSGARADEEPVDRSADLAKQAFRHVGEAVGELLIWKRFVHIRKNPRTGEQSKTPQRESIVGEGNEIIDDICRSGRGAVGLSAHLGSFELLAAFLAGRGLKCSVIGRSPNYPSLERVIREFRQAYGVEVIWSNASDAARQMITAIRNGRVICALIDQDTKWNSEFSPFFGLEAASPIAPIQLALRYDLPLFTSFIVRSSPMSHQVLTEAIPYRTGDLQAKGKILRTYNERLEKLIRRFPEQYIWWHRRWRRRPGVNYEESPELLRNGLQYRQWLASLSLT